MGIVLRNRCEILRCVVSFLIWRGNSLEQAAARKIIYYYLKFMMIEAIHNTSSHNKFSLSEPPKNAKG